MQLNQLIFPAPRPSYSRVSIALLPNTELLFIESGFQENCFSCNVATRRSVPVLIRQCPRESSKYLLYFHSNSEDMQYIIYARYNCYEYLQQLTSSLDINIILVEYPGYGIYTSNSTSESIITEDAISVYEYFLTKRRVCESQIAVVGRSIGCGPACFIASKYNPAALITISAYCSLAQVAEHLVGALFAKFIKNRFNNIDIITKVTCPMLVIHGLKDELIPFTQSKLLLAHSNTRVKLYHFSEKMTHNSFDIEKDIIEPLANLFNKIDFVNRAPTKIISYQSIKV